MKEIAFIETHVRKARVILSWADLQGIVRQEVLRRAGLGRAGDVSITISDEAETAGSAPYRVGTRLIVEVEQDLMPRAIEELAVPE